MKRRTSLKIAAAGLLGLAMSASALAQPKEKVTVLLNWYVTGPNLAFYLGKERGYFDQEGIDLQIQEGRGSGPAVQAVAGNNVTFAYADIGSMIKLAAKGAPVKAVGVALQTSPLAVISLAEKNIKKPEDLKGKTIAMTPGDSPSQMWPMFAKKTGLKDSDYKTVNGDAKTKVNAVINGQADALLGFVTDQTNEIEQATKKPTNAILYANYDVNSVGLGVIANTDTIKNKPDLVKRFMRAATKTFEETAKNPDAAIDAALKANGKGVNRDALASGLKTTLPLLHTKDTANQRPFRVSDKAMKETVDTLVEYGGLDKSAGANPSVYYTNEFLP